MIIKNIKRILILIILILALSNCSNDETISLIDSSIAAGNLMSEYYDNLIQYTIETWELEAFNSSLRDIDFPIETQAEYQNTIKHLEERKAMIQSFVKILPSLKAFTENKAPEDFKKITTELGNNIAELKPIKDNKIAIPSEIFGNLSQDIIQMYKYFEIKSISKTLVKTLEKMRELFEKENKLYQSIIEERNNKSMLVVNYMIDNELVIPWSLIDSAPGTVDLQLAVEKKPAKDAKTKLALKKVLEVKYYRFNYLIKSAENDLSVLMSDLINTYNEYIQGKKVAFENIAYIANRIGVYFNEISEYKDALTGKTNYTAEEEIVYHGNSDSKIFHSPSCQYYNSKNCNVKFYSREEAIKAGYTPCTTCKP